jgi:hypothetical protein
LKRVVNELPLQLKKISEEQKYSVTMAPVEGAVLVSDGAITVKVSLTSPLLREPAGKCFLGVCIRLANEQKVMKSFAISSYQFHILWYFPANHNFLFNCSLEVIQQVFR